MWQKRYGFIRLAAKMGYTIVPFAAVGPDEYYNQHMTGPELQQAQLVQLLTRVGLIPSDLRSDLVPPLPAGVFGSPLPKPKTTFYGFAPAIDLSEYAGKTPDEPLQRRLRKRVADAIDREIKQQLLLRERQRHQDGLLRRILSL
jgi:1-acyl-sn-glycerol-3-phosphate acyltransferase